MMRKWLFTGSFVVVKGVFVDADQLKGGGGRKGAIVGRGCVPPRATAVGKGLLFGNVPCGLSLFQISGTEGQQADEDLLFGTFSRAGRRREFIEIGGAWGGGKLLCWFQHPVSLFSTFFFIPWVEYCMSVCLHSACSTVVGPFEWGVMLRHDDSHVKLRQNKDTTIWRRILR